MSEHHVDLNDYVFEGLEAPALDDLRSLSAEDKEQLLMAGVDVEETQRSGSFLHLNHSAAFCKSVNPGVEILRRAG